MTGHGGKRKGAGRKPKLTGMEFFAIGTEYLNRERRFIEKRQKVAAQNSLDKGIQIFVAADPDDPASCTKTITQNYIDDYRDHLDHINQIPVEIRVKYKGKDLATVPGGFGETFGDIRALKEEVRKKLGELKLPKRPYGLTREREKIFQKVLVWGQKRYGPGVTANQLSKAIKLAKRHFK